MSGWGPGWRVGKVRWVYLKRVGVCVCVVCVKCAHDDLPSCPLPNTLHSSAAGQFFPEAAQVAYQMWELSAVARVEVRPSPPPAWPLDHSFHSSARTFLLLWLAPSCPLVANQRH